MASKKEKFNADEKQKFSLRKVSGIGAVSAIIGIVCFSSLPLETVFASETDIKVNYKYATTDELTESEKNLIVNELPKDLIDGSDLFVIYRKDSANGVLPNTGSNVLPLASLVGTGLLVVAYSLKKSGKKDNKIVKTILSISLVGGALTVTTVSALTVATLVNYNHTETITIGSSIPDGKIAIPGYHFVGYIDGKNVNTIPTTPVIPQAAQDQTKQEDLVPTDTPKSEIIDDGINEGRDDNTTPSKPKEDEITKPSETKVINKIVKVDEAGNILEDVTGYTIVSTSKPIETREIQDGQLVIVRTVTEVYKRNTVSEVKPTADLLKETNLVVPSTLIEVLSEEVVEEETSSPTETHVTSTVETPAVDENSTDTAPATESLVEGDKKEETPSSSSTNTAETTVKQKKVIRTVRTTEDIPFEVVIKEDSSLAEGEAKVETEGKLGKKVTTQKITLVDDVETAKETVSETREEPQKKVVLIGTKKTATQPTASEVGTSTGSNVTPTTDSKDTTPATPLPGYYTVEVTESENKTVITEREKVRELLKDRTPFLNLGAPDGDKSVQIKIIEVLDNNLLEGQRELQDIQASYVTVNIKKRREVANNEIQTELVVTKEIPLITKVYHLGTKTSSLPRKDVVISGHVYDSNHSIIEEGVISICKNNELVGKVNTDSDGYMFTRLELNQSYILKSDGFETKITPILQADPVIENIKGSFELGRKYSDDMINYRLKSKAIYVDDGQYQNESDDGKKIVLSKKIDVRAGDILIVPPSKNYETYKAVKVSSIGYVNNQSVVEYTIPSLYEVIQSINTQAWSSDISSATFIPAEGVKVEKQSNTNSTLFRNISLEGKFSSASVSIKPKKDDGSIKGKLSFEISGKVWSEAVDFNFWVPKIDFMNFDINTELKFTTSGSLEFSTPLQEVPPIPLGELILPTPVTGVTVNIPIELKTSVDGSLSISVSSTYSITNSIKLKNWSPEVKNTVNHTLKFGDVKSKATVKSGPEIKVKPKILGIDTVSVSAKAGVGIDAKYSNTSVSSGKKEEHKINLSTGVTNQLGTLPVSVNKKKFSIETFGYLTLKATLDILKQAKKYGFNLNLGEAKLDLVIFDGKLPFSKYEIDLDSDYSVEIVTNPEVVYKKLTKPFVFASGAGAWGTELILSNDGSFKGAYHDSNLGITGPGHPNGQMSISNFTGKFKNLSKVSDYEYKMTLSDLSFDKPGESKIINGVRIDTTEPYGLADKKASGKNFILYLPGRPVKDLPEEVGRWIYDFNRRMPEKLTRAVIFNKDQGLAFVESDYPSPKVSAENELAIREIIHNGPGIAFSKLVPPSRIVTSNDLYVNQLQVSDLLNYFNTYNDATYQKEDVIKELGATVVSDSLVDYTKEQWHNLSANRLQMWVYSEEDDTFYDIFKYGRDKVGVPVGIDPSEKWVITNDGIELTTYIQKKPYQKLLLKKNNKQYDSLNKTLYYISKITNL